MLTYCSLVKESSNVDALAPLKLDPHKADPTIDISRIDLNKDLNMATSALEFFIISLSKHLSLTPKQVILKICIKSYC